MQKYVKYYLKHKLISNFPYKIFYNKTVYIAKHNKTL